MTRLLRAEFRRFYARRLVKLGFLGVLGIVMIFSWSIWSSSSPPSAAELAEQKASFEQALKEWETYGPAQLEECKKAATAATPDPNGNWGGMTVADCEAMRPSPESYQWTAPRLADELEIVPSAVSISIGMIAIVLAASYIGAEFTTGSMGNWLTYEPRRGRVFATKMIVVGTSAGALALVGTVLLAAIVWVVVKVNGGPMAVPSAEATHTFHTYWRGIVAVMAMALVTAGLAFLTRHTAAVIGMIVGWMMIVEGTLMSLVARLRVYSLSSNLDAWTMGGTSIFEYVPCVGTQTCEPIEHRITWIQGGGVWGLLTAGIVALAWLVFSRRDVT